MTTPAPYGPGQPGQSQPGSPGHPQPVYPPPGYPQPGYPPPGYPPTPMSPGGQPLASFGDRLLAYIIDIAILTAVALVLAVPVFVAFFGLAAGSGMFDENTDTDNPSGPFLAALFGVYAVFLVLILASQWVYLVEMQYRSGQTVGKRAMKIRVVPLDPRQTLTRGMAGKRFLIQVIVASCVPAFNLLDGLWQLWDKPFQQCLHDKYAQTVVVKVGP